MAGALERRVSAAVSEETQVEEERCPQSAAFLFPGQGLQPSDIVSFYQMLYSRDRELVDRYTQSAQEALSAYRPSSHFHLVRDLENENSPSFLSTAFVQPVVYMLSVLALELAQRKIDQRITPSYVAGHSLGECAAITAARGVQNGIELVIRRGHLMQQACEETPSKLVSIMGLSEDTVADVCKQTGAEIALVNAPTLIVVGTQAQHVEDFRKRAEEKGARRTGILPTAGAFHTSFMQSAQDALRGIVGKFVLFNPEIPVVLNTTGKPATTADEIRRGFVNSMTAPVRWADSIEVMKKSGVEVFIELGPGNSLAILNRFNGVRTPTLNLDNLQI